MTATLFRDLELAIGKWVDEKCDGDDWLDTGIYIGNLTVNKMAAAAAAVFDGIAEAGQYERENG